MLLLIMVGKFLVWTTVVWLFRYPIRTAIAVAAGLTQIGELSFVVVQFARSSGIVADNVFGTVIAASLISILLNVFIVRGTFAWMGLSRLRKKSFPRRSVTSAAKAGAEYNPVIATVNRCATQKQAQT
jgi:CPA2 family monovalent cation:H+ antiporter-2